MSHGLTMPPCTKPATLANVQPRLTETAALRQGTGADALGLGNLDGRITDLGAATLGLASASTIPGLWESMSTGSPLESTAPTSSIPGPQVTPILIPLTQSTDQDLTPVAAEQLQTGTKRAWTTLRG